ncbi:hypothetical protein [Nocardioides jensenii]|uniref:hypothetical protein n=1 Tax=Nocardioides jensenii TaxID=1843 RepID=UPI0008366339|nr:hypothetical protein [Nocardioides jensenii]
MSDPIKDLESFDPQGLPMNPLTPSEVRRRGDRLRRRNNGVMALGTAAAVAVIATSGVLVNNAVDQGEEPGPVSPSQTESPAPTQIPDDFPLAAGVRGAEETDTAAMSDLDYCGATPLAGLDPADVRSIALSGGETSITRTLYLLDTPEASVAAHEAILDAAAACTDGDPEDTGDVAVHGPGEGWPGSTVTEDFAHGESTTEPSVEVVDVVSAGRTLLVTSTFGSWSTDIDTGVADERQALQPVMVAMSDFGPYDAPGSDDSTDPAAPGSVPTTIPGGFPLGAGWPDDSEAEPGKDMGLQGPNRTLDPLEFTACGEPWQEPSHADRLRADWNNVEDYRYRQLTTYADADAAVAAVASLVAQQQACPVEPQRDDGYVNHREVRKVPAGGEAWAILERDTMNGSPSPFGASALVLRVGSSVLIVQHGGHGGYPDGNGQGQIDAMTTQAAEAIGAMCRFTVAGCGGDSTSGTEPASATNLGPDGWGELKIGMTAAEMEATGLVTIAEADDPAAACRAFTIKGWADTVHPNVSGQVHGFVSTVHGLAIIFAQPGMKTPEGIGVGSTVDDVRAAYGELTGQDAYNTVAVDGRSWFFLTDGSKVTAFQLEHADQDCVH